MQSIQISFFLEHLNIPPTQTVAPALTTHFKLRCCSSQCMLHPGNLLEQVLDGRMMLLSFYRESSGQEQHFDAIRLRVAAFLSTFDWVQACV